MYYYNIDVLRTLVQNIVVCAQYCCSVHTVVFVCGEQQYNIVRTNNICMFVCLFISVSACVCVILFSECVSVFLFSECVSVFLFSECVSVFLFSEYVGWNVCV